MTQLNFMQRMKVFRIFVSMGQNNKPERFARPPAVAGRFYPGSEKDLRKEVEQLFRQAQPPAEEMCRPLSVRTPDTFSGGVAASAFNQLDRNRRYRRIFLIGSSHRVPIKERLSIQKAITRTPMGTVKVDTKLGKQLAMSHPGLFTANSHAHAGEHSLEVQLPFLQHLYANNILLGTSGNRDVFTARLQRNCPSLGSVVQRKTCLSSARTFPLPALRPGRAGRCTYQRRHPNE